MAETKPIPKHHRFKDLTGQRFERWTVVGYAGKRSNNAAIWLCRCDCGTEKRVASSSLIQGHSRSCGCLTAETTRKRRTTHGMSASKEYKTWQMMIDRCTNPNSGKYAYYGGRGISVCARWLESFENFIADMGSRPSNHHSIDRIDSNGPYSPENCRWATLEEQRNNQGNNHLLTFEGKTLTIAEWAKLTGISQSIIKNRINRYQWTVERALTTPPKLL